MFPTVTAGTRPRRYRRDVDVLGRQGTAQYCRTVSLPRFRRKADALLVATDTAVGAVVAVVAFALRFQGEALPSAYLDSYYWLSGVTVVAWIVAGRSFGLYRRNALRPGTRLIEPAFESALATGVIAVLVNSLALGGEASRAWIALVTLGLLLAGVGARELLRRARRALVPLGIALERYAILGTDADARRLHADLTRASGAPFTITELLPAELTPEEIASRALATNLDGILIPAGHEPRNVGRLAGALSGAGVEVFLAPALTDLDLRVTSLASFHGVPLLRVAGASPRRRAVRQPPHRDLRRGVAILGTRGIPASYGGFETFAEELAPRLVDQSVPVTVYCRRQYASGADTWQGVRLITLPTVATKYLDTVTHTTLSVLHLIISRGPRDVILCNAANAPLLLLLRLVGRRTILNVDGLEWRRGKWGVAGRAWYRIGEWFSVRFASVLVTDAEEVRTYYRVRHETDSIMIPYGAEPLHRGLPLPPTLPIEPDRYFLYVSRWEPENNPTVVAAAHTASGLDLPLVMLGQPSYDARIDHAVRAVAVPATILPGAIYGSGYKALQANALAYVHATEVGGTHPALIEALGAGNLCLVLDTPENRGVAGAVGWLFADGAMLTDCLRRAAALTVEELNGWRARSAAYAAERYSWAAVAASYLVLLRNAEPTEQAPLVVPPPTADRPN